jgi:manganese-dependent inorganic pyrophosphatase
MSQNLDIMNTDIPQAPLTDSEIQISRKRSVVEKEFSKRQVAAHEFVSHLPAIATQAKNPYIPNCLSGAIFCGHLVTDLDSIAGSIGAAELYGGVCARASEVNSETAFALELWGAKKPRPIEELLVELPDAGVCLVDHQQTSQLNKSIEVSVLVTMTISSLIFFIFANSGQSNCWCH